MQVLNIITVQVNPAPAFLLMTFRQCLLTEVHSAQATSLLYCDSHCPRKSHYLHQLVDAYLIICLAQFAGRHSISVRLVLTELHHGVWNLSTPEWCEPLVQPAAAKCHSTMLLCHFLEAADDIHRLAHRHHTISADYLM